MNDFPFGYERIPENSWAYLSSLLMLALFFKFNRFWTMRNLDLWLIILLAPGILMIYGGINRQTRLLLEQSQRLESSELLNTRPITDPPQSIPAVSDENGDPDSPGGGPNQDPASDADSRQSPPVGVESMLPSETPANTQPTVESSLSGAQRLQRAGYVWLFSVGVLFLIRSLLDPLLVRRPLLEPNLSVGGLVFLCCSFLFFLFVDYVSAPVELESHDVRVNGPGFQLVQSLPVVVTFDRPAKSQQINNGATTSEPTANVRWEAEWAAKGLVMVNQVMIVLGLIFLGTYHFQNFRTGLSMVCIYLMLPYTIFFSAHPMHLMPAALVVWALVAYRRPIWAGLCIGAATGIAYYPLFLLPLWFSFYWDKGAIRFAIALLVALGVCVSGLFFASETWASFWIQLQQMFGFWLPVMEGLRGIWSLGWDANFRLPILVAFLVLVISFVFWPARKDFATLLAYSAAVLVAVQFWHGFGGGLYMAWYVPLMLATFFRPNLAERDSKTQVLDGWLRRSK